MINSSSMVVKKFSGPSIDISSWGAEKHKEDLLDFLKKLQKQNMHLMSICGSDDRTENHHIDINSDITLRATCHLAITYDNGETGQGTGFFVGPKKVVTAAHCILREDGVGASNIIVRPGIHRNEQFQVVVPFLGQEAVDMRYPAEWESKKDYDYDYGLLTLENEDLFNRAGGPALELWAASEEELKNKKFFNMGYSKIDGTPDNPILMHGQHQSGNEEIKFIQERRLLTENDVLSGDSGGPLILEETIKVVGICSNGGEDCSSSNGFTRIIDEVKSNVNSISYSPINYQQPKYHFDYAEDFPATYVTDKVSLAIYGGNYGDGLDVIIASNAADVTKEALEDFVKDIQYKMDQQLIEDYKALLQETTSSFRVNDFNKVIEINNNALDWLRPHPGAIFAWIIAVNNILLAYCLLTQVQTAKDFARRQNDEYQKFTVNCEDYVHSSYSKCFCALTFCYYYRYGKDVNFPGDDASAQCEQNKNESMNKDLQYMWDSFAHFQNKAVFRWQQFYSH
ncbi:trypsin-like serine peptidase [Lysinibacillus xylanilyticus]|uniref:trypsin-like serine peptidase n=1 Tax=Lysinibacillus xylanilyticus TaxID=582475 RepID=UPI00380CA9AB